MMCPTCRLEGELKVFSTFQYWYCGECREEIPDPIELEFPPADWPSSSGTITGGLDTLFGGQTITFKLPKDGK